MRFEGQLRSWNAERGFGFIEPAGGGQDIFLHVSAVPTNFRPPKLGQQFTFDVTLNREGKKRASNVGVAVVPRSGRVARAKRPAQWCAASALAIPAFVVVCIAIAATRGVSIWGTVAYIGLSIVALFAYALDKSAAVAGRWRSSEQSLLLRHKSSKTSFRHAFWGTVLVNVAAFLVFHAFRG